LGDAQFPSKLANFKVQTRISIVLDLFAQYSTLDFTFYSDKPAALKGLEARMSAALSCEIKYGICFKTQDSLFQRSLFWCRQQSTISLQKCEPRNESPTVVPTWSWLAYQEPIEFPLARQTVGAEWTPSHEFQLHEDANRSLELSILVSDLKVPGDYLPVDVESVLDSPGRWARVNEDCIKCVIIGRNRPNETSYVLYIVLVSTESGTEIYVSEVDRNRMY
jgi:hypothetical protein